MKISREFKKGKAKLTPFLFRTPKCPLEQGRQYYVPVDVLSLEIKFYNTISGSSWNLYTEINYWIFVLKIKVVPLGCFQKQ